MSYVEKGFTLLELIVVITIVALSILVIPLAFPNVLRSADLRDATRELVSDLRIARGRAIAYQRDTIVTIDARRNHVVREQRTRLLKQVQNFRFAGSLEKNGLFHVRFHSDGSSSGGAITLIGKSTTSTVHVDWLTGRVKSSQ